MSNFGTHFYKFIPATGHWLAHESHLTAINERRYGTALAESFWGELNEFIRLQVVSRCSSLREEKEDVIRRFTDRYEAGRLLARKLEHLADRDDVTVLALPRGGVPVACEVANHLNLPLDVFVVRKLGVPGHEELAMGAIAPGQIVVLNEDLINYLGIPRSMVEAVETAERKELDRRDRSYRGVRPPPEIENRTIVLVDDGLATGSTMRAAISAVRRQKPERIIVAVPVAPPSTQAELEEEADEVVSVLQPDPFDGVGRWYSDFSQTSDDEVRRLLDLSKGRRGERETGGRVISSR